MQRFLKMPGMIRTAENGSELGNLLIGFEPDFILTDLQMPGVDGLTALKSLFASGRLKSARFLVVSGRLDGEAMKTLKKLGVPFLEKPAEPDRILRVCDELFNDTPPMLRAQ